MKPTLGISCYAKTLKTMFFHGKSLFHTSIHRLAAVHHHQVVQGKNPEIGFVSHESTGGFEGLPEGFSKFSRNPEI